VESLITIIGRGHSGTRAMSHTLSASGVFMGEPLNGSGDLVPADAMYEACRVFARQVEWHGGLEWDWSATFKGPIPGEFVDKVRTYLASVLSSRAPQRGWKLPETTLCYPWIQRMFPEARYIYWTRDPRDSILGAHLTDDLTDFGVPYPPTHDPLVRRAVSWKYQYDLMKAVPRPAHWIAVRFEDFVLKQAETLERLEAFLGLPLKRIPVRPEAVGRWRRAEKKDAVFPPFLDDAIRECGYPA